MTTDLQALIQHLRGGDWNLRAPQEMADMIADKLEAALAAAPSTSPAAAPTFDDALKIAKGCFDYKGGYDDAHLEIFHHGIGTVVAALTSVAKRGFDSQSTALHRMGSEAETAATASVAGLSPAAAAVAGEQVAMTDERIDHIADLVVKGMPDGIQGFCKSWGWRQFARAVLDDCRGHYRTPHPSPSAAEQAGRWAPLEPTPEMVVVMHDCEDGKYSVHEAWRAILAAAPSASPAEAPAEPAAWTSAGMLQKLQERRDGWAGRPDCLYARYERSDGYDVPLYVHPQPVAPAGQAETPKCRFSTGAVNPWSGEKTAGELAGQAAAGVQGHGLSEALYVLDSIDDYIARINGDDRGACELVNALRALLAAPAVERGVAEELADFQKWKEGKGRSCPSGRFTPSPTEAWLARAALSTAGKEQA